MFCRFCRSSLLKVVFLKNFRERTFVFGWCCWSCVFWWVFAYVFVLLLGVLLPKVFGKISLMSGLVFFGFVLFSSGFFSSTSLVRGFFLRETVQVVTGHPLTRTCFAVPFCLFCVPPLLSVSPVLAVRPASWWFFGVPFWAPRVFGIFLEPSEVFFLGREAARVFLGFSCLVFFFPCVLFCGHTFSKRTGGGLTNPAGSLTHPSEE